MAVTTKATAEKTITGISTVEKLKLTTQLLRLLIGLSSGALILVATFLGDVFSQPVARSPLLIGVLFFGLCVLFSMLFLIALTRDAVMGRETRTGKYLGAIWVFVVAESSFVVGLVSLAVFVIWNLSVQGK